MIAISGEILLRLPRYFENRISIEFESPTLRKSPLSHVQIAPYFLYLLLLNERNPQSMYMVCIIIL